jgi:hypothetical protein
MNLAVTPQWAAEESGKSFTLACNTSTLSGIDNIVVLG